MKISRFRFCRLMGGLVVAAFAFLPTAAEAKKKNNRKRRPATKKGAPSELPTVTRVGSGSITVGGKYYEVSKDTKITVNGEDATLGKIKQGMQVLIAGSVLTYGADSKSTIYKATRITASTNENLKKKAAAANKKANQNANRKKR